MSINRRAFVFQSGAAALALGFHGWRVSSAQSAEIQDIRVAVIGTRGRGRDHIMGMPSNVVALCDVDQHILEARSREATEKLKRKLSVFTDYRRLLEDPAIDAISIATPNHTHALIAIEACQAGKDVYVEKPVSQNVWEGRQLVAAAERYDRVVQCGTQARSSTSIRQAVDYVRAGNLGSIQYAVATCYKPRKSIGQLDHPLLIPSHIDYDLWCGPAEMRDLYRPSLHYDWHWDYNTGGGDTGNQGIHQLDIARWFLGESGLPRRVYSIGARVGYLDAGETPNTEIVYYDYKSAPLVFECRGLPKSREDWENWDQAMDDYRQSQVGVIVQCERGHVHIPVNYDHVFAYDLENELVKTFDDGLSDHYANWLSAVASHNASKLNGSIVDGHVSSALCHLANISHRLGVRKGAAAITEDLEQAVVPDVMHASWGRMQAHLGRNDIDVVERQLLVSGILLDIDPATETIVGNELACELLKRNDRQPFAVPKLADQTAPATT